MGSNWAQEFREKVEASEGKYGATENFDDVEEEVELEEPENEVEEETEVAEQEPEEAEAEKPVLNIEKRTAELMDSLIGQKEPAKQSGGGNPGGAMMAAMMGLLMLQSLPTIFNAVSSAFQPIMPGASSPQDYPVQCQYCGYQCLGYNGMPCPQCGRS